MEKNPDPRDDAVAAVLADGRVEIDLSDPPSRADLAVPDGRRTSFLERPDRSAYEVVVTFTDGTTLTTPAHVVGATTDGESDPTGVTVLRHDLTLEELEAALRDAVAQLGVDEARVESYLRSARTAQERETTVKRALPAEGLAPERVEVQPIAHGFDQRYQLNYLVDWGE